MTQRGSHHGSSKADDEDDVPEWVDQVMATVAAEVRRRRKELGWSAQDLADRCAEIGHPIPRNVIANMESGRRSNLPLVDVMVLAEALNTPPICLLYPVGYIEDVQRLPLQDSTSTLDALRWFTGEQTDLGADDDMLRYFRAHHAAQERLRSARRDEEYARYHAQTAPNADRKAEALRSQARAAETADDAEDRLRRVRAFIEEEGVTPPFLWPDLADVVDSSGSDPETSEENDL
ncbi:helix-turn-helix transcriptional regulator [Streptomyces sp. MBT56]|uniref:helix-turn-helix domain-containing protein n=1 Tax=unclassified Streptomyces TaxID=2593676 RepID=UPI00190C83F6|nr:MULTISPECIES: helix-turn-helix transcriptional regulator [unclassified Streptomyces]MBK3560487.1 helix-turn-helix transcriptional regulator [Streptomyces sp. MBT56]MBK3600151.1 helix-turn-helix transcriptional regulator [Streptomyces sp. MBT54]MBK3613509.1 helix-turn-helix transcriptional regulator [Streptomyces sp. MBT98]